MARTARLLTDLQIKALKPPAARTELAFGGGLYLILSPTGGKSWALRYRWFDKPMKLTLGRYASASDMLPEALAAGPKLGGALSIAGARLLAQRAAIARDQGVNPAQALGGDAPKTKPKEFAAAFAEFLRVHVAVRNRPTTAKEAERLYRSKVLPVWKGRPVSSIRRREIIDLLEGIRDAGAPVSANRTLALVRKFFNWCVEQELLETSPCSNVRAPTPELSRERELSTAELRLFWRGTERLSPVHRAYMRMLLLTGQRRSEVSRMRWSELTEDGSGWKLSRDRTKNNKAHIVHLSPLARKELQGLIRLTGKPDYVFTTGRQRDGENTHISGFSKLKASLDTAMRKLAVEEAIAAGLDPAKLPAPEPWRPHDLRRTLAAGMQRLGIEERVVEKIINHEQGSRRGIISVYQVYGFEKERRAALDAWAAHIALVCSENACEPA